MKDSKNISAKKAKNNINNESRKENKHITLNEDSLNIKIIHKKNNNQNHIDSINIINNNTNYKNIILNNMLTPNKKLLIKDNNSSRNKNNINNNKNNIKIEHNILFDNNNINANKKFRSLGQNKRKTMNNNNVNAFKLIMNNQEQENLNDIDMKYKLILYEKNNLINKLKNEVEYYKNFYHNINMNMNIILPNNNNNTIEANNNRISLGLNDKKNIEGENIRNRIRNIFSLPKKEIKFDNNHLMQHNINDYNTIKTFVNNKTNNDTTNYNSIETAKDYISQIKNNNFNTIENNSINNNNNQFNNNKLLLSNDSLKNDLLMNNTLEKSSTRTLNNIFYRSNSNTIQKKGRKLKLGLQQSELTLDINGNNNNFNSIDAKRNYENTFKNKKHIIYSLNYLSSKTGSDNELDNHNNNGISIEDCNINRRIEKGKKFFSKISSSPSSLYKDMGTKNTIDASNSGLILGKNDNTTEIHFNYKENFEKIKKRMNILINNLFDLIEVQNKKTTINNSENK